MNVRSDVSAYDLDVVDPFLWLVHRVSGVNEVDTNWGSFDGPSLDARAFVDVEVSRCDFEGDRELLNEMLA
jgi:hypothetical protein